MGLEKNKAREAKDRNGKRGSTDNASRLAAFDHDRRSSGADWGGCSADKLQGMVVAITELGGAVIIGLTRDKGAHSLTLLLSNNRKTFWFNGDADLDEELDTIIATLGAPE